MNEPTEVDRPAVRALTALDPPEEGLLSRAQQGEHRAQRDLYKAYEGRVRAQLQRLIGSDAEIDDVVQTVFVRAFRSLDRFQGQATLSTWFYRITANALHNALRQRFRRDRLEDALRWLHDDDACTSRGMEARDEAGRILRQLDPDLREVFLFYHYEGLTLQEISNLLGKPVSTVGDRLARARRQLRELTAR